MKFISLFSGIGGFDLGFERAGMECVAQVEIDDFCGKVLKKHWPDVPLWKDVRDVGKHNLPAAELICGGFPCQDVSLAGKRAGLKGKRSTLWSEFYRIICEIQPRWVVVENVRGLLSSDNGEFMRKILWELSSSRYVAEWNIIPATYVNAYHLRERVIFVAYLPSNDDGSIHKRGRTSFKPRNILRGNRAEREWLCEPDVGRVVDGVSDRMDKSRLKALGNAVVPQVAEWIGVRIMSA